MLKAISPNPESDAKLPYSHGILTSGQTRTLYVAGQVGIDAAGVAAPDFDAQARQAWSNLMAVLAAAGMEVRDLAKITAYLTSPGDYAAYTKLRGEYLGGHKPASTLVIAAGLARPDWKFEIEAIAVAAA